jgi:HAE1 family hydrophobic/amphiphilic exporter-1
MSSIVVPRTGTNLGNGELVQALAEVCIRRPVFAAMLVLALVVVGATAYFKLGVDRFPAVDLPTVTVRTSLPGGAPEDVES